MRRVRMERIDWKKIERGGGKNEKTENRNEQGAKEGTDRKF